MNVYQAGSSLLCTGMAHLGHVAFGKTLHPQHPADRPYTNRPGAAQASRDAKRFWRRSR